MADKEVYHETREVPVRTGGGGAGWFIAGGLLVALIVLFLLFGGGMEMMGLGGGDQVDINVDMPSPGGQGN